MDSANNNPKLIQTYIDFFVKNFKVKDGLIDTEHFIEFFVKETKQDHISEKTIQKIYKSMEPVTVSSLLNKAEHLGIELTEAEAKKIVKMVNHKFQREGSEIKYEDFYKIVVDTE